ncbi:MAG: TfoX/Sxy family protein [Candidatus Margulisbacteria bacterium]|nr:TfoX/Sxy family protein [Candidatus Margulisiibacteriota bacterium]
MTKEYLETLSAFIEKVQPDNPENIHLECKHFFSGAALYAEGRICITLTPVGLALKLPEESANKLLRNKEATPLRYFPKSPIKNGYVLFPGGVENEGETLHKYVKESISHVLTLSKPKRKKVKIRVTVQPVPLESQG